MNPVKSESIILGIDPGTIKMGFAVIKHNKPMPQLMDYGVLNLQYIDDGHEKLHQIFVKMEKLIQKYQITELAIEAPFFGKNVQSMLKLGKSSRCCYFCCEIFRIINHRIFSSKNQTIRSRKWKCIQRTSCKDD
jgi:crossover junction endodeoxyribonuclease RuvC